MGCIHNLARASDSCPFALDYEKIWSKIIPLGRYKRGQHPFIKWLSKEILKFILVRKVAFDPVHIQRTLLELPPKSTHL